MSEVHPKAWDLIVGEGPVLCTAIHAGHGIRDDLQPLLALSAGDRLREEDPLTDYFLSVGDVVLRTNQSRFEVDLNRPTERCIYRVPEDSWGLKVWSKPLPDDAVDRSRAIHARFYIEMERLVKSMIAEHGHVLVLDMHSYNHRRDGADAEPAPADTNPVIDIGATTLDQDIFGPLLKRFAARINEEGVDARINVRWPDGGNFPEWLHRRFPERACIMTLEFKKVFMDEWTGKADILTLQHIRAAVSAAVEEARAALQVLGQVRS